MLADNLSRPTSRDEFEIAIVCTRALEFDAVCLLLDNFWDTDGDPFGRARGDLNNYTTGCMSRYNIVVMLLCNSGKATAAGAAASLRSSYPCIELIILVGICEGVPDANGEELLLGDVVISETVIEYDLGTQHVVKFKKRDTLEDRHGRANKNIRNFIANIKTELGYHRIEEKAAAFLEQIQSRTSETKIATYMYPGSANDILFKSTHYHRHYNSSQCVCAEYNPDEDFYAVCDDAGNLSCEQTGCELNALKVRDRIRQKNLLENSGDLKSAQTPSIFFGCFGSGDTVFNSGAHRDSLAKTHGIIAFEMEGAGIWDELPCIIVKGVSDYGDGHKTRSWKEWQNFAAATAASVARALVERYPQTDKPPVTELKADKLPVQLQENKACRNALFITSPEDDKQRIEETKGGLLLDAYIWIIRNEGYIRWLEDPETHLLWIKGDPGKGKTMLLCGIINELKETSPRGDTYYFLCQATDGRLNNASAILRGLLHMMVVQRPSLISYVRYEYDKSGKSAFEGVNSWVVLLRIFEQILRDDLLEEPIFIIDALDECLADSTQLLEMLVRNSSSSRVKWLVSSRNEAHIREALAAAEKKSTVSLELNAESVSAAITTYIQHKVQILSDKRDYELPVRDVIEQYLSKNANGTFLWVALVCTLLDKVPRSDPLPKSADFPPGLDQLYERMISRVCDPSISDIGRKVLAIAAVAYRPLTKEELVPLINNRHHDETIRPSEYDWEDILGHCGSFLTMRSGTVYFVHQSAKDFLIKEGGQRLFPRGMEYTHREVLEVSIASMRNILRNDMYSLVDPAFSIDDLSQNALNDDPLIPIRYGCVYWIDHFEHSIPKSKPGANVSSKSHELIYVFLKEKFVHWLEALSLLRSIFDGMEGMQRLEQLVADSETSGLLGFVRDARKFTQMFGNAIADYPLQVYVSALIFSPTQSICRRQFKEEAPNWIQSLPQGEAEWGPSSRTYGYGKFIQNLAVSCCGTRIASSHPQATITIWKTYSGKTIRVLNALSDVSPTDSEIRSLYPPRTLVCFSPWNSEELVSSCYEYGMDQSRLVVWDVTTGKISQQLQIEGKVTSMSYLNSSSHIFGFLQGKFKWQEKYAEHSKSLIVSIWNTETGQMIKRIELQEPGVGIDESIFSHTNDSKLALCKGPVATIINLNTDGTNDNERMDSIKFSPDGSFIVLRKHTDVIVPLSNTSSKPVYVMTDGNGIFRDMKFSPDGSFLALTKQIEDFIPLQDTSSESSIYDVPLPDTSPESTIYDELLTATPSESITYDVLLSDTSSGDIIWSFRTEGLIDDFTFSPNGKLLAIAAVHGIGLFSTISGKCVRKIAMSSNNLIFSFDGSKIFCAGESAISVIDIGQETFETSSSDGSPENNIINRRRVALSPNGRFIASVFMDRPDIEVMEIGSTNSTHFLRTSHHPVEKNFNSLYLFFSPNSKKLFIGSDGIFILWDISSEPAKTIFKGGSLSYSLKTVVFSLDSERLAIAFANLNFFNVQVWDTSSGKWLMHLRKRGRRGIFPRLRFSPDNERIAISYFYEDFFWVEIWEVASVSALQTIDLGWHDFHSCFQTSNLDLSSKDSCNEEDQENEKLPEEVDEETKRNKKGKMTAPELTYQELHLLGNSPYTLEVHFIENDHPILDILPIKDISGRSGGIRVALQIGRDREPTGEISNMIHFREAKSYELDSELTWVKFNGKRLVWIPPQYRTDDICSERNCFVFPYLGRSLFIIQFVHSELVKQMSPPNASIRDNIPYVPDTGTFTYLYELGDDWKIVHRNMNAPDDKMMYKINGVDEIKDIDTSAEVAQEDIVENYSSWQWTVLGF
ncbi:hypothetical protein GGI35DRAFT_311641 [Trichoderma velutinum]